jgi:hypothetical protein
LGPAPVRSSRKVSMTKVAFSVSRSILAPASAFSDPVGPGRQAHGSQYVGVQPGQGIGGCQLVAV